MKSRCRNNYMEDYSHIAITDNTDSLPVKDVLSPRIFTPFFSSKPKFFCDFEISVLNDREQKVNNPTIVLKDIEITNIENYADFDLPLKKEKTPGKPLSLQKKDIKETNLLMPTDSGQVFTLCEESGKIYPFHGQVLVMGVLFDEKLFETDNLLFCRLVIHQQNPEKNWVTQSFFIQDQEPKISYQYRHNYTANIENRWDGQKMGVLTLSNEGPGEVYLQVPNLSTKISAMAVYSNFSKENVNHRSNQILEFKVFWIVDDGLLVKKRDEKSPDIYKLESGQSMSLSLKTHDGFLCDQGQMVTTITTVIIPDVPNGFNDSFGKIHGGDFFSHDNFEVVTDIKQSDCKEVFYLSGLLYHLHAFPKITYNLFGTMDYQKWQTLGLEKLNKPQYDGKFSQWVPNYQAPRYCQGFGIKHELKNYPTQNHALSDSFECRLDNH